MHSVLIWHAKHYLASAFPAFVLGKHLDILMLFCYSLSMRKMSFQGGVFVVEGANHEDHFPAPWQQIRTDWRCEGYHYETVRLQALSLGLQDTVPRWQHLDYEWSDEREPHDYQEQALKAWQQAQMRGSIVLPTGAGKSFIALRAIHLVN